MQEQRRLSLTIPSLLPLPLLCPFCPAACLCSPSPPHPPPPPLEQELQPIYAELKEASKGLAELSHPRTGTKDADISNAVRGMEQGSSAFSWPIAAGTVDTVAQGLDSSGTFVFRASKAAKDGN